MDAHFWIVFFGLGKPYLMSLFFALLGVLSGVGAHLLSRFMKVFPCQAADDTSEVFPTAATGGFHDSATRNYTTSTDSI